MGETMYPSERPSARIRTGVVIRTKDRPAFLRDALASVAAQDLRPVELVLVNDGGEDPGPVLDGLRAELEGIRVVRVDHSRSVGRSPAAQSGLEAAGADFVTFLDDDDALLPHHLSTLAGPVETAGALVSYADVECLTVEAGETGRRTVLHRAVFASEFDPSRLFFENYIPIMAVLMDRQLALDAGGFDPELEYFEDWDLWLRLARRTPFHHCPEVTATYYVCPEAGQGRGTGGEHRWPHMARLFDKHRGQVHGTDWVDYFRTYVEPTRERLVALETRWPELHDAAEAADRLRAIESSRSWRAIQRLRRLLGRS